MSSVVCKFLGFFPLLTFAVSPSSSKEYRMYFFPQVQIHYDSPKSFTLSASMDWHRRHFWQHPAAFSLCSFITYYVNTLYPYVNLNVVILFSASHLEIFFPFISPSWPRTKEYCSLWLKTAFHVSQWSCSKVQWLQGHSPLLYFVSLFVQPYNTLFSLITFYLTHVFHNMAYTLYSPQLSSKCWVVNIAVSISNYILKYPNTPL